MSHIQGHTGRIGRTACRTHRCHRLPRLCWRRRRRPKKTGLAQDRDQPMPGRFLGRQCHQTRMNDAAMISRINIGCVSRLFCCCFCCCSGGVYVFGWWKRPLRSDTQTRACDKMPTPNRQIKVPPGKQSVWMDETTHIPGGNICPRHDWVEELDRGMRVLQHRRTAKCVHANPCDEAA